MKSFIIDTLIGLYALDEMGNLLNFRNFEGQEEKIIEFYSKIEENELVIEYTNLLRELTNSGFHTFVFDNEELSSLTSDLLQFKTEFEPRSLEFQNFRFNLHYKLKEIGFSFTQEELSGKYKSISEELIKKKIKQAGEKLDVQIIQTIETLEFIKPTISKFSNKIKEWYGIHFPELVDQFIEDDIMLAELIYKIGNRKNYKRDIMELEFNMSENQITKILELASESMGAEVDLEIVRKFASQIISLDEYRITLEEHLESLMQKTAPNIQAIVGSLVGAKLIAEAGGLRKLAFMPSSRIQLLGAETALYRYLKTGEKLPKHGIIFQWQQIRGNPSWIRGNIARLIAGKLGIAAKLDYFSGDYLGDQYAQEIQEKIEEIKKKYPNPPKTKEKIKKRKG
ncbi:MAG: putative NOP5 family protein [Promethearchaeota archaeon]|nr:MAG: putative NOP5 family protein [Candidatus Lokiarchaeota archaeon]